MNKEAIEIYKNFLDDISKNGGCTIDIDFQHKKEYETMWEILRIIEKQQAEKEDCKKCILRNEVHNYIEEIEKKDKKIALLEQLNKDLQSDFEAFKKDKDIHYLDGIHHKQLVEKSIGQKIDKPEECWFDIFEVKLIKNEMLYGITINEDFINLKQISDSDPDNCITVIAESPLSGAIYRYNNYGTKEWQLIGTMLGYA